MKRTGFKQKPRKPLKRTPFKHKGGFKTVKTALGRKKSTKPKKAKPIGKVKLNKALWKLFSKFIRDRDNYICFTCGKKTTPGQAGHYRTGATCKKYLFYDERNVHCQCYHCNINLSGNWRVYQKKMWDKYGVEIDHEFDILNQKDGWDFPYQEKIEYYKKLNEKTTQNMQIV